MTHAQTPTSTAERGPQAVREKLIAATLELISERSPAMITNKEIAARAGVNHGQIHHYFESKDDLVAHAILAHAHGFVGEFFGDPDKMPVPINTRRRSPIWRALAYLAVHAQQLDIRSPVIERFARSIAQTRDVEPGDPDVLADVAAIMAMTYGWSVFEDYIVASLEPFDVDVDAVRDGVAERSTRLLTEDV